MDALPSPSWNGYAGRLALYPWAGSLQHAVAERGHREAPGAASECGGPNPLSVLEANDCHFNHAPRSGARQMCRSRALPSQMQGWTHERSRHRRDRRLGRRAAVPFGSCSGHCRAICPPRAWPYCTFRAIAKAPPIASSSTPEPRGALRRRRGAPPPWRAAARSSRSSPPRARRPGGQRGTPAMRPARPHAHSRSCDNLSSSIAQARARSSVG